jgi:hypothetical protein
MIAVVVVPRSFDAGTEVLPGERNILDCAFSPTHRLRFLAFGLRTHKKPYRSVKICSVPARQFGRAKGSHLTA